jgi:hypothetical protein
VLDNYATHKHPKVKAWLARHPRFAIHFTPKSCSWLNAVETPDLEIDAAAAEARGIQIEINTEPKPLVWTVDNAVLTIGYVANLMGEDEDWLHDLSIDMLPRMAVFGSTAPARTRCRPSPKTASEIYTRSSVTREPPGTDRRSSRRSSSPASPLTGCSRRVCLLRQQLSPP